MLRLADESIKGADVLVVGSGTAGLTVALELARAGIATIVATTGARVPTFHLSRAPLEVGAESAIGWSVRGGIGKVPGYVSRVGGRSVCWHGVVIPPDSTALAAWPSETMQRIQHSECSFASVLTDLTQWKGSELVDPLSAVGEELRRNLTDALGQDFTGVPQAAVSWLDGQARAWHVYSPLDAWTENRLDRYADTARPLVRAGLRVTELMIRNGLARGVIAVNELGEIVELAADHVVLAAGTLESTRLLAQAAFSRGAHSSGAINILDHIVHGVVGPASGQLVRALTIGERAFLTARLAAQRAGMFAEIHADGLPRPIVDLWFIAELQTKGSIIFDASSRRWEGSVGWALGCADRTAIIDRQAMAERVLGVRPAGAVPDLTYEQAVELALSEDRHVPYLQNIGSVDHEHGTLPLGDGEISPFGASLTVPNVSLASPACFPALGGANPSLALLGLSRLVAATIVSAGSDQN